MFEKMGCKINAKIDDPEYKSYKIQNHLKKLEHQWDGKENLKRETLMTINLVNRMCNLEDMALDPKDDNRTSPKDTYVCISCKRNLFVTGNVVHFNSVSDQTPLYLLIYDILEFKL
jgi:hypothetical protein